MKKYALILNPMAGRGRGKRQKNLISEKIRQELGDFDLYETRERGHAREIAEEIKNDYAVIIAAGGDGTMHEVVNGMMNGGAALAAIPIGSGNDFVKMLNLPKDPGEAVRIIKDDLRMKIDVGKMGDYYFPNGLGIGFDAWVVKESMKVKRLRGFLIYLYSVLKTAFQYKNEPIFFSVNGQKQEKSIFLIAVGNGVAMGGGFYLTPQASITDGKFDVCIIHALNKRNIFLNLPKAMKGKHLSMTQVEMLKTDKLKVTSDRGIAVHADGELLGMNLKELDISILPAALEVIYKPAEQEPN